MIRLLIKKTVFESILLFLACAVMLFVFCWSRVWIVCQFDLQQFKPLLDQFRMFEKYSPVPLEQLLTYAGSIGMTFNEPVVILCMMVWAISRGSDVVSGEIGRGTLEMLLSQPISRARLLLTHSGVCIAGLLLLCTIAWLGIYFGIYTNSVKETLTPSVNFRIPFFPVNIPIPTGESQQIESPLASQVSATLYALPTLNLFCFAFFVLACSSMLSCFDRYRWRTIGIMIGIYVIQFLMFLLSKATDWTGFVGYASFFSCYQPDAIVMYAQRHPESAWSIFTPSSAQSIQWPHLLGPVGLSLVLLTLGITFYTVAWLRFRSRDLPAPL